MFLKVAAHNVSIPNVKVTNKEHHKMYSVTKRTVSQNVFNAYIICTLGFVLVYITLRGKLCYVYV
jgi:hypothetical protein